VEEALLHMVLQFVAGLPEIALGSVEDFTFLVVLDS
jgi:hypothetical protein